VAHRRAWYALDRAVQQIFGYFLKSWRLCEGIEIRRTYELIGRMTGKAMGGQSAWWCAGPDASAQIIIGAETGGESTQI
jgi:hypothetical protein